MPERPPAPTQERVTLPLLALITQQSMDEDYLHVAERRALAAAAGDPRPVRSGPHRTAAVVVAVFGILVATAAVQTSRNEDVDAASRATLVRRITDERQRVADLQERVVRLRERNARLDQDLTALRSTNQGATARLRRLQVPTGYVAVRGPGIVLRLDDGPSVDPNGQVLDRDLRVVVNGLWRVGAEAIAINDQRLTALSAIRISGSTIRVNRVNLSPPYRIEVVGDNRTLQARFLDSEEGRYAADLEGSFGITFSMTDDDSLELPAARLRPLRSAEPLEDDGPRPEEAP